MNKSAWRFCIAPMLDWTTPQCRIIHRALNPFARLYSEMISASAVLNGDYRYLLQNFADNPCALQLGGGDPFDLAKAVEIAQEFNYQEINLNAGCPSNKVAQNQIGACLMKNPRLIAKCLTEMQKATDKIISLKHRLAIDHQDERQVLDFVDCIVNHSPCRIFIIHARKAWLSGLNPKKNRDIPPLNYDLVYEVKQRFGDQVVIVINGGIETITKSYDHLQYVDGVMLGRSVYHQPLLINQARQLFNQSPEGLPIIINKISNILKNAVDSGERLSDYFRHLLGLFHGQKGARIYRQQLSLPNKDCDLAVWQRALKEIDFQIN